MESSAKQNNATSETGVKTEKQLHALYDNLKKEARKNMSDDQPELYKTSGTCNPKTTIVDEKVVALLTPQFKPMDNEFDSSAPYYNINTHDNKLYVEDAQVASTSQDNVILLDTKADIVLDVPKLVECAKRPPSPLLQDFESTPKVKKMCLTETINNNINNISSSIIKRKQQKQTNEDVITNKKLEILEIQKEQEQLKLEKTKILFDLDIELKKALLQNAQMNLEFKRKILDL